MPDDILILEKKDANLLISLNRPEKRNALNMEMMEGLRQAFTGPATDADVRSVIVNGLGKGFSSGIDYFALASAGILTESPDKARRLIRQMQDIVNLVDDLEKPVIFALHGFCYGMALELALAGDFRIAQPGTMLGLQEVTIGLIPDVGGTTRLTKLVGPVKAKELIMTAKQIDAEDARRIQLVNQVEDDCLEGARLLASQINKNAPLAVGLVKKLINRGQHLDQRSFMELEAIAQTTILYSEDVKEGMLAKMEKREPVFKGK